MRLFFLIRYENTIKAKIGRIFLQNTAIFLVISDNQNYCLTFFKSGSNSLFDVIIFQKNKVRRNTPADESPDFPY